MAKKKRESKKETTALTFENNVRFVKYKPQPRFRGCKNC